MQFVIIFNTGGEGISGIKINQKSYHKTYTIGQLLNIIEKNVADTKSFVIVKTKPPKGKPHLGKWYVKTLIWDKVISEENKYEKIMRRKRSAKQMDK